MATVVVAMADKKMTIRCEETGESFEVTVPDGLRIYEYNGNWLYSIPYLTEHARNGEPWAYEALGDCYRYGRGGVAKSIINAFGYYDLAGKDADEAVAEIAQTDNDNEAVVFSRLVDYVIKKDYRRITCAIDTLNENEYHSADILLSYVSRRHEKVAVGEILEYVMADGTDPDAAMFAILGASLFERMDSTISCNADSFLPLLSDKVPFFSSVIGERAYQKTIKSDTLTGYAEDVTEGDVADRHRAVEYLLKADKFGALSRNAAQLLLHYIKYDSSSKWLNMPEEDLARIEKIAGQSSYSFKEVYTDDCVGVCDSVYVIDEISLKE